MFLPGPVWYSRIMFLDLKSYEYNQNQAFFPLVLALNCIEVPCIDDTFSNSSLVNLLTSHSSSSVSISSYSVSISVPMTSYFLFEASSSCSTGHSSKGFIELDAASVLMLISFPFSLSTTIFLFWDFFSWTMFFPIRHLFCFFFFTQYLLHSVVTVWETLQFCDEISTHLCFNQKFTQNVTVGKLNFVWFPHFLNGQMISCSLAIGCF